MQQLQINIAIITKHHVTEEDVCQLVFRYLFSTFQLLNHEDSLKQTIIYFSQ